MCIIQLHAIMMDKQIYSASDYQVTTWTAPQVALFGCPSLVWKSTTQICVQSGLPSNPVTEVAEFLLPMLLSQHMQPLLPRLAFVKVILFSEKCITTEAKMFTNDDQQLELSLFSKKTDNSKVEYCISRYD